MFKTTTIALVISTTPSLDQQECLQILPTQYHLGSAASATSASQ